MCSALAVVSACIFLAIMCFAVHFYGCIVYFTWCLLRMYAVEGCGSRSHSLRQVFRRARESWKGCVLSGRSGGIYSSHMCVVSSWLLRFSVRSKDAPSVCSHVYWAARRCTVSLVFRVVSQLVVCFCVYPKALDFIRKHLCV